MYIQIIRDKLQEYTGCELEFLAKACKMSDTHYKKS